MKSKGLFGFSLIGERWGASSIENQKVQNEAKKSFVINMSYLNANRPGGCMGLQ